MHHLSASSVNHQRIVSCLRLQVVQCLVVYMGGPEQRHWIKAGLALLNLDRTHALNRQGTNEIKITIRIKIKR
jgi:hypothetical protein